MVKQNDLLIGRILKDLPATALLRRASKVNCQYLAVLTVLKCQAAGVILTYLQVKIHAA